MSMIDEFLPRWLTRRSRPLSPRRERNGAGFSEEALRGLQDLDARTGPPESMTQEGYAPPFRQTERLSPEHSAGGGLVTDDRGYQRPHYHGHRERLRQRFLKGGHTAMPDYEVLELTLFNAIPRIDVKPLAKRLLAEFGDLSGVLAASEHRLLQVPGATSKVFYQLRLAGAFAERLAMTRDLKRDVLSSWDALIRYCRTAMAHRETEQFRAIYLNTKNQLLADEAQAEGTVDHVPVYPREIAKRALALNASAVILVHNHPTGDATPSRADIEMTEDICFALRTVGVRVHDHVIIGGQTEFSFAQNDLLV